MEARKHNSSNLGCCCTAETGNGTQSLAQLSTDLTAVCSDREGGVEEAIQGLETSRCRSTAGTACH